MNYLGLDYGERFVGVAVASSPLAEPFATFEAKKIFNELPKIVKKLEITKVIIGNCPGDFLNKLNNLGIETIQVDETLSTVDAQIALLHTTQSRRKEKIHEVSAAIILQNYLDSIKQNT